MNYPVSAVKQAQANSYNKDPRNKTHITFVLCSTKEHDMYKDAKGKVIGNNGPESFGYPLLAEVVHNDTTRIIRYAKGQKSVFLDEQFIDGRPATIDMLTGSHPQAKIERRDFKKGMLVIPTSDKALIEFMRLDDNNGSNPNRRKEKKPLYVEVDSKQIYTQMNEAGKYEAKAIGWIYDDNRPFHELQTLARTLEQKYTHLRGLSENASGMAELQWFLKDIAKQDPKGFMADIENPLSARIHYIIEAMKLEILTHNQASNTLAWGQKSGRSGVIYRAVAGGDPVSEFATLTMDKNREEQEPAEAAYQMINAKVKETQAHLEAGFSGSNLAPQKPKETAIEFKRRAEEAGVFSPSGGKGAVVIIKWPGEEPETIGYKKYEKMYDSDASFRESLLKLFEAPTE